MRVWKYGDDVNTDMLFPGKYTYTCSTPEEVVPHLLEDLDPEFAGAVSPGDIVMAGKNFGCGSSREQPVLGLKAVGVAAVVAEGFARTALDRKSVVIEAPEAVRAYGEGDEVALDVEGGRITIAGRVFGFPALPPEILAIRDAGGLLAYARGKLEGGER